MLNAWLWQGFNISVAINRRELIRASSGELHDRAALWFQSKPIFLNQTTRYKFAWIILIAHATYMCMKHLTL